MSRRYTWTAALALVALFFAACTQAPPPAPPDTRANDEKAIRDVSAQWLANYRSKDAGKTVSSFYSEDAALLGPGTPVVNGRDAILKLYQEELADPNIAADVSISKVEVAKSGEIGYEQGSITMTFTDSKTKKPVTQKGKYVIVYKKQSDGSWKAVQDVYNTDGPAQPANK